MKAVSNTNRSHEQVLGELETIRHLLSLVHTEVSQFESTYEQMFEVLRKFENKMDRDDLTQLLRRDAFFKRWHELLNRCEKLGQSLGFMMIDVDHFKRINDEHGHAAGDEVLRNVAAILKKFESSGAIVGRYGGEEFAMALAGNAAEIEATAEMVRREVESVNPSTGGTCTVSVGLATSENQGFESKALVQAADQNLYKAKESGRNRVIAA